MHDNARFAVLAQEKVRATHQEDGGTFGFYLQNLWLDRLQRLPFGEGDGIVPIVRHRADQGFGLFA